MAAPVTKPKTKQQNKTKGEGGGRAANPRNEIQNKTGQHSPACRTHKEFFHLIPPDVGTPAVTLLQGRVNTWAQAELEKVGLKISPRQLWSWLDTPWVPSPLNISQTCAKIAPKCIQTLAKKKHKTNTRGTPVCVVGYVV